MFGRNKDEIFKALQEREQFKQDLDSVQEKLKREQKKAITAQGDLREQIGNLERELSKQREENVKNLHIMKEVCVSVSPLLTAAVYPRFSRHLLLGRISCDNSLNRTNFHQILSSCNNSVKIRLVTTCHIQICHNLLKHLAASLWVVIF